MHIFLINGNRCTNKNLFLILIFVLYLILTTGCGSPFKQTNISTHELYRSSILHNISIYRIGFLTTAVSRESSLGEYRVVVSNIIEKTFRSEKPKINIISSREIINKINSANLTGIYAEVLDFYDITGILNKDFLKKIGDVLNVKYVAQPKLLSFTEATSVRLSALGLSLISTRETTLKVSLQVWDTFTGNIIWEGSGQATIAVEAMRAKPVTFEEVAEVASLSVVKKFPF
ncbi:MAG: hypothetical protein AABZ11_05370 [Nitrospinota bacterium]